MSARARTRRSPARFKRNPAADYEESAVDLTPASEAAWDAATALRAEVVKLQRLRAAWELAREIQRDARALAAAAPSPWHEHLDKRVAREHAAALASAIERLGAARDSFATARELLADHLGGGSVGQIKWGVVRLDAMLRRLGAPEGPRGRLALAQELLAQGIV